MNPDVIFLEAIDFRYSIKEGELPKAVYTKDLEPCIEPAFESAFEPKIGGKDFESPQTGDDKMASFQIRYGQNQRSR